MLRSELQQRLLRSQRCWIFGTSFKILVNFFHLFSLHPPVVLEYLCKIFSCYFKPGWILYVFYNHMILGIGSVSGPIYLPFSIFSFLIFHWQCRKSPISVAAAAIYMISQLSNDKKALKGKDRLCQVCWIFKI